MLQFIHRNNPKPTHLGQIYQALISLEASLKSILAFQAYRIVVVCLTHSLHLDPLGRARAGGIVSNLSNLRNKSHPMSCLSQTLSARHDLQDTVHGRFPQHRQGCFRCHGNSHQNNQWEGDIPVPEKTSQDDQRIWYHCHPGRAVWAVWQWAVVRLKSIWLMGTSKFNRLAICFKCLLLLLPASASQMQHCSLLPCNSFWYE